MTRGEGSKPVFARWRVVARLAFVVRASAASADTYLVISLVGDRLTILGAAQQAGSHMATTGEAQVMPLKDSQFDDFAVRTAGAVIGKALPGATVTLLRAKDPELDKMRNAWLDADSIEVHNARRPDQALVRPAARQPSPAHRSVPRRTATRDGIARMTARAPRARGLGFYIDGATPMHDSDSLTTAMGFLGVLTYFQILLINLGDNGVGAQERVIVGTTFVAAAAPDKTPGTPPDR